MTRNASLSEACRSPVIALGFHSCFKQRADVTDTSVPRSWNYSLSGLSQEEPRNLTMWSGNWQMSFCGNKYKVMYFEIKNIQISDKAKTGLWALRWQVGIWSSCSGIKQTSCTRSKHNGWGWLSADFIWWEPTKSFPRMQCWKSARNSAHILVCFRFMNHI